MDDQNHPLDEILAQSAWVRALAQRLVSDVAERDDVVQQAWLAALTSRGRPKAVRPWFFGLVRNVARMELRRSARRRARDAVVASEESAPGPDEILERVEVEREVVKALVDLAEPYRSTLLLRYYEDLTPTEIARRLEIPAGTVRWRLKHGLDELRTQLDRRFNGDRRRSALALLPTAAAARTATAKAVSAAVGGLFLVKALKILTAVVCVALLLLGSAHLLRIHATSTESFGASLGTKWRTPGVDRSGSVATVEGVAIPSWFGQRGVPNRRIAGRVKFAGAPVEGATVELGSQLSDVGVIRPINQRTNRDGRFDFGVQPPAHYSVAASARSHSPTVIEVDTRDPSMASEHLNLRLGGCEAALFGRVNDASGGAIAGAKVCYTPPRATACVETDDSGRYDFCIGYLQPNVEVSAKGYGSIVERVSFAGSRVQRDFQLTPEAVLVGRVVRADNGTAVAGARVSSTTAHTIGERVLAPAATVTNGEGRFMLAALAPGRHRLSAAADGFATTEWIDINVEAGHITDEILLPLSATSRISGIVTDGHDPIVGATVSVGDVARSDAVTQADGSFVLEDVSLGKSAVRVVGYEVREPKSLIVDRPESSGIKVVVEAMASISGRVTYGGKPFAGALVGDRRSETLSDDSGNYRLRGLIAGKHSVWAGSEVVVAFGRRPDITLAKGEQRTGVDIEMQYASSISGTVVETNGAPAVGVYVRFEAEHRWDGSDDITATDGSFHTGPLVGADDYVPFVRPSQRSNQRFAPAAGDFPTVHVADGASHITGVRLIIKREHLSISGTTVDGDGQPLSDVRVTAFRNDGDATVGYSWIDHPNAISRTDGSFTLADLDAGSFTLEARAGDGSKATIPNVVAGTSNVAIELQSPGGIDGTLAGFARRPSVAVLRLEGGAWTVRNFATVDANSFHVRGLETGAYTVTTVGQDGGDAETVEVHAGQNATVTLRNRGTATVKGRVYEWKSGAPVAGCTCKAGMRASGSFPAWDENNVAVTDGDGQLALDGVPAGTIAVGCKSGISLFYSDGMAPLTVGDGQTATVEIPLVERNLERSQGSIGAQFDQSAFLVTRITAVQPRGPADRAGLRVGDTLTTVDGQPITNLTQWGAMFLILDRPLGTNVRLGVIRSGSPVTATVTIARPFAN